MSELVRGYSLPSIGAGDLIDRAVRLYRQHFLTFFFIASPPVLIGTLLSAIWWFLVNWFFYVEDQSLSADLLKIVGSFLFWLAEITLILCAMGGASRNFINHILFKTPFSFRETYSNTFSKLSSLLAASFFILFSLILFASPVVFFFFLFLFSSSVYLIVLLFGENVFSSLLLVLSFLACLFFSLKVFFLIASRFAYIPQIIMIEGKSLASAISRSFKLAKKSTNRVYALFAFTFFATISVLTLLYLPLFYYTYYVSGIGEIAIASGKLPTWYIIANALIFQLSLILLSPVLMIGLCILYIDSRIKHEAYDIELMALQVLGKAPELPEQYQNPLEPALSEK